MVKIIQVSYWNHYTTQSKMIPSDGISKWDAENKINQSHWHSIFCRDEILDGKKGNGNVFSKITTISKSISSPYATLPRNKSNSCCSNPFVEMPNPSFAIEYKKGYIRRKCCYSTNGKRGIYNHLFLFESQSFVCILCRFFSPPPYSTIWQTKMEDVLRYTAWSCSLFA